MNKLQIVFKYLSNIFSKDLFLVFGFILILLTLIVPIPVILLDFLLSLSITISLVVLIGALYIKIPSKMTILPPLILILTLFRVGLNIATTKSILGEGHNGPEAVSNLVGAFGEFVVSGNYVIGLIIFLILVLFNFMVITKGASRVAEVSARFSLDSLPGKQMAIDADLNAGFIDDKEAQKRREELQKENGFYGSLDGASKFVQNDAIFGLIVTFINIIGGILIGMFQQNMSAGDSASTFTILTIGDGLVSQIPALITSIAVAIMITRSSSDNNSLTNTTIKQLGEEYKVFLIVGISMGFGSLIPGFPSPALLLIGFILIIISLIIYKQSNLKTNEFFNLFLNFLDKNEVILKIHNFFIGQDENQENIKNIEEDEGEIKLSEEELDEIEDEELRNLLKQDLLVLRLGVNLFKYQESNFFKQGVKKVRKDIAKKLGILIPKIDIKMDSSYDLEPNQYSFEIKGVIIGGGTVEYNKILAIPGSTSEELDFEKIETEEPIHGMKAYWINKEKEEEAIIDDYVVLQAENVITKHITSLLENNTEDILTRQNVVDLIENFKRDNEKIAEDLLKFSSYGNILYLLKELLNEKIPINNLLTIFEAALEVVEVTQNQERILEHVRGKMFKIISRRFVDSSSGALKLLSMSPTSEQFLIDKATTVDGVTDLLLSGKELQGVVESIKKTFTELNGNYDYICIVVDPLIRKKLSEILHKFEIEGIALSHSEIDPKTRFDVIGQINIEF